MQTAEAAAQHEGEVMLTKPSLTILTKFIINLSFFQTITVLPRNKKDPNASGASTEATPLYTVGETITVQNVPFAMAKGAVKA